MAKNHSGISIMFVYASIVICHIGMQFWEAQYKQPQN